VYSSRAAGAGITSLDFSDAAPEEHLTATAATRLPDQPSTPPSRGESSRDEAEPTTKKESLRTRALRQALLTLFPCGRALDYGVAPDDDLSTSDSARGEEKARLTYLESLDIEKIKRALASYGDLHREEEARKSSAETRLTTVLGMSSIVSAITFGFISVAFEKLHAVTPVWMGDIATIAILYAVFQLVISVWHAVRGLQVRKISELTGSAVLWKPDEQEKEYLLRCVRDYSEVVHDHDGINSDKTRRLDLAHRAILNFLGAVLVPVVLLAVGGWIPGVREAKTTLAEQLRADPELVEILRGPKGDRGDVGPQGAVGPPGPRSASAMCLPASAR